MLKQIDRNLWGHDSSRRTYKVAVVSMGCKVNRHDQALLEEHLVHLYGNRITLLPWADETTPAPDLLVVNTCTVTAQADKQGKKLIRSLHKQFSDALILVTGCGATVAPGQFSEIDGVVYVAGNAEKPELASIIGQVLGLHNEGTPRGSAQIETLGCGGAGQHPQTAYKYAYLSDSPTHSAAEKEQSNSGLWGGRTRPFLAIEDGCDNHCTYCIIPHARGTNIRSTPPHKVMESLQSLGSNGAQEVVLTGINLGKYGTDIFNDFSSLPALWPGFLGRLSHSLHENVDAVAQQFSLANLIKWLDKAKLVPRIRLSSIELPSISEELILTISNSSSICHHFHIPLQSGSDRILNRMGRTYVRADYFDMVMTIYEMMPDAGVGTDIIVGFPGETDDAFEETRVFVDSLPLSYLHVFPFSPRPGTPAAQMDNVPDSQTVQKRAAILRKLGDQKKKEFAKRNIGKEVQVLIECYRHGQRKTNDAPLTGFAGNYLPVLLSGSAQCDKSDTDDLHFLHSNSGVGELDRSALEGRLIRAKVISYRNNHAVAIPID